MKLTVHSTCLFIVLHLLPGQASAQALPGQRDDPGAFGAEYRMHAAHEFQRLLGEWTAATHELDVDGAADHYRSDAYLDLGQADTRPASVEEALEAWLGQYQLLTASVADFAASGAISYGAVRLRVRHRGSGEEFSGSMVLILRRHGRDWRIRSQKIVVDEIASGGHRGGAWSPLSARGRRSSHPQ